MNVHTAFGAWSFCDLLDSGPSIRVRATITLLPTEGGGRNCPARRGYSPNHNFDDATNREFYIGRLELNEQDSLAPGETREIVIHFLSGPDLRNQLIPGRSWRIQEGPKLVGEATILEVLET